MIRIRKSFKIPPREETSRFELKQFAETGFQDETGATNERCASKIDQFIQWKSLLE